MIKHFCDRCHDELGGNHISKNISFDVSLAQHGLRDCMRTNEQPKPVDIGIDGDWELCEPCSRGLYAYMEKGRKK